MASRNGQALTEAIIALTALSIGLMGIFALLSQSLGLNRVVADNYVATYLATEGIEVAKNIIDSQRIAPGGWPGGLQGDWEVEFDDTAFQANQNRALLFDPATNRYAYAGSRPTPYRRLVRITQVSANHYRVNSIVSWTTRGGGSFSVDLEDHFYNWR